MTDRLICSLSTDAPIWRSPPDGTFIQFPARAGTEWTPASGRERIPGMPPQLTDYEMETIARACRALSYGEQESARKIDDPALRAPVQQRAKSAAALAERFERARKSSPA
jgi:hypothetical protein